MAISAAPVQAKPARLALLQLASPGDGSDKAANLAHARAKIAEAVRGGKDGKKPDLVVLPVRVFPSRSPLPHPQLMKRSTRPHRTAGDLQLALRDGHVPQVRRADRVGA